MKPALYRKLSRKMLLMSIPALMLAGCAAKSSGQERPEENIQQDAENAKDNRKNQNQTGTDQTSSGEEKISDDIELDNLSKVSSSTIDLSSVSSGQRIDTAGTYTIKGKSTSPVVVDADDQDVTLKLDSCTVSASGTPAIYVRNAKKVTFELTGTSSLNASHNESDEASVLSAAIYSRAETVFKGTGSLNLNDETGHGIKSKDDLTIENGKFTIGAGTDGINASDAFFMNSGSLNITAGDEGIDVNETIEISGGTLTIDSQSNAIRAEGDITLTNGTYNLQAEDEGIESKSGIVIKNGTYTLKTLDDCINAASSITIEGGTFSLVSSTNDCIDSNGDMYFKGGTIQATALQNPEGAFDIDRGTFEISGGTIVGQSATATMPTDATQNTVMIAAQGFEKLELKQNGKTLITFTAPSSESSGQRQTNSITLTLSCAGLEAGKEAELVLDGNTAETFTVEEGLTTVGNISTMGGMGGMGGPGRGMMNGEDMPEGEMPDFPEGEMNPGERPDFDPENMPEDFDPDNMPEDFDPSQRGPRGRQKGNQNNAQNDGEDAATGSTQKSQSSNTKNNAATNSRETI